MHDIRAVAFVLSCHLVTAAHSNVVIMSVCVSYRGENIILFLVQTVGRQTKEQKQYRPSRIRAGSRKTTADPGNFHSIFAGIVVPYNQT